MKTTSILTTIFNTNFLAYYRAHVAHVNVTGRNFISDHKLLGKVYEDLQAQVDTIAELLRTLKTMMPTSLNKVIAGSSISGDISGSADKLLKVVYDDLELLIKQHQTLVGIATEEKADEIANYAQDRILALKKLCWMLESTIGK